MRQNLLALAVFMTVVPAGVAYSQPIVQSQEGIALENQILQLQQQVQTLQAGSGGGGSSLGGAASPAPSASGAAPASSVVTQLLNQVGQLQAQVQQLNGEVDTLQNQVNTQHDATEKEIGDLKFQMSNGGAVPPAPAAGAAPAAPPPAHSAAAAVPAKPQEAVGNSPHALLRAAETAYAKHDDTTAESYARSLLAHDNSAPEAYHAQFLLAQILTSEGKPQDAAIAYDDAYNRNRTGSDAASSLLGLASSLSAINQNEAACDTLSSLNSQFPTPSAGMKSRIAAVSQRAHCS